MAYPRILIKCTHLASVPGPNGTYHHIAFDPTPDTVERVDEWRRAGDPRVIEIEDRAGEHVRTRAGSVVDVNYDYGTLWITTDV